MDESINETEDKTIEICLINWVFWLSDIINRCSSYCSEIYEDNECIKDTVDTTVYLSEYAYKACSGKREEPMEKSWISTNYTDISNNKLIDEYFILDDFRMFQFDYLFLGYTQSNNSIHKVDEFSTKLPVTDLNQIPFWSNLHRYTRKTTDLVILKGYDKSKKESYYICLESLNLTDLFRPTHISYLLQGLSLTNINNLVLKDINNQVFKPTYSNVRFLSITYRNGIDRSISIQIDKEWLVIGNEILGYTHVFRMLEYQSEPFMFNMDYTLDIIDSDIKIFELKSNQFLKMEKEGYSVKRLDDELTYEVNYEI